MLCAMGSPGIAVTVNVRRLLAKLAVSTSSPEPSTLGMSPDQLTASDIAAVVGSANIHDGPRLLVKVKWGLDDREVHPLLLHLTKEMIETARRRKWRTQAAPAVWWRLSVLSLRDAEVIKIDKAGLRAGVEKCQGCYGVGLSWSEPVHMFVTCSRCKGTTKPLFSDRRRAFDLGIDKKSWVNTWEHRFGVICNKVRAWEGIAISEMRARLS